MAGDTPTTNPVGFELKNEILPCAAPAVFPHEIRYGGAEGSRTPDLLIANETLYQLSYDPNQLAVKINPEPRNCK
jgi:hypothetical protein